VLAPAFQYASRSVIQALLSCRCVALHPVLGFLTGPCHVGFAGRNHNNWWISGGQGSALPDQSAYPVPILTVVFRCVFIVPFGVTELLWLSE